MDKHLTPFGLNAVLEAVAGDSTIIKDYHFGFLDDVETGNWLESVNTKKNFPAILVTPFSRWTPVSGNRLQLQGNMDFTITLIATSYYKNDGTPDPFHTYENYIEELRIALQDYMQRVNDWRDVLSIGDTTNADNQRKERLLFMTTKVTARLTNIFEITTMKGSVSNEALDALMESTSDPKNLLTPQQKRT